MYWVDSRDMSADGLTKGCVSRDALHCIMNGVCHPAHPLEHWQPRQISATTGTTATGTAGGSCLADAQHCWTLGSRGSLEIIHVGISPLQLV